MKESDIFGRLLLLLVVSYSSIVLLLDYLLPLGTTLGVLYTLVVFSSSFIYTSRRQFYIVVILCSCFLVIGFFLSPASSPIWIRVINRCLVLSVIWIAGWMGIAAIEARIVKEALEARFHIAIEAAPTAMLMVDEKGEIVLVNQQSQALFGYSREELIRLHLDDLLPQRYRESHPVHRQKFMTEPRPRKMGEGQELYALRKDGTEVPVEIGLTPVTTEDGSFVISSIIDITERKMNQRILERKNFELAQVNEELSQFAYRTSHDLKAPLTAIQGLAHFIEKDMVAGNSHEAVKNLHRIVTQSKKLSNLVTDILSLTKADLEQLEPEEINFSQIIHELSDRLLDLSSEAGVCISSNVNLPEPFRAPAPRISQILDNLISNGIKYSNPKSSEKFVRVEVFPQGDDVVIRVCDNGLGIPERYQGHLFRMFKRFHPNTSFGSGLGLSIVKKHVDRMNGNIKVASSEQGTLVEIIFPRTS